MEMNRQDWAEYASYLRKEVNYFERKRAKNNYSVRTKCILNYNLLNTVMDLKSLSN